jgi:hypothetical protein
MVQLPVKASSKVPKNWTKNGATKVCHNCIDTVIASGI